MGDDADGGQIGRKLGDLGVDKHHKTIYYVFKVLGVLGKLPPAKPDGKEKQPSSMQEVRSGFADNAEP